MIGPSMHLSFRFARLSRGFSVLAIAATIALASGGSVRAEGQIRIAEQFGVVYLLLNIAQDLQLIEKNARSEGLPSIKVEFIKLSGGPAINDALLSGNIDVAAAGIGPLMTIWDRTYGRQNVRGIASLGNFPNYLITTNPNVKSIADFTDKDRIALPAVSVSVQARILQLASAKLWGDTQFNKLDRIQITLPHPDATAALIKGGTEITAHFSNTPFQEQLLAANPNARVVLDSYKVLGGPSSAVALYATEKYRKENPRTYKAFVEALNQAVRFVKSNPEAAADVYLRVNKSNVDRKLLLSIIQSKDMQFQITPQNTLALAQFMQRVGAIKNKPASAKDYFFDDPHNAKAN
jgi:NitT/TauT family transport system substrate-binding protein